MPNRRFNKQVANQMKSGGRVKRAGGGMGGRTGDMMYSRGQGMNMKSKRMPTELMDRGAMKKGGKVGKKKQGYKARKDESIAMRIRKKRTKKQLKASRDESYGRFMREFKKGKLNIGGSKKKVKNRKQAIAIALSEAGISKKNRRK
jgi:hypothetical protein